MRRVASSMVMTGIALLFAPVVMAQPTSGYDVSWNDCIGLPGAAANLDYACDGSRDGNPFKLVVTFVPPIELPNFAGVQVTLQFRTQSLQLLPDWWRLDQGECHEGAIEFPSPRAGIGSGAIGVCIDPWASTDSVGGGYQWRSGETEYGGTAPGFGTLKLAFASATPVPLQPAQRYLLPPILIDPVATGEETCAGCELPGCIAVTQVELYQVVGSPGGDIISMQYRPIERLFVTWQGGAIGGSGCPAEVPAKRATWGAIKAIYR